MMFKNSFQIIPLRKLFSALLLRIGLALYFPEREMLRRMLVRWIDECVEAIRYNLPQRPYGFSVAPIGDMLFCIEFGDGEIPVLALLSRTNQPNVDVTYQYVEFDDAHFTDQWGLHESAACQFRHECTRAAILRDG